MKSAAAGKTRLGGVLEGDERRRVIEALLSGVIGAAHDARSVARVIVMSDDPAIADVAARAGAWTDAEAERGLNRGLAAVVRARVRAGAAGIIILPGDLGWVAGADIDRLLAPLGTQRHGGAQAALATDHLGVGTSALAWSPAAAFSAPAFGPGSADRHARLMRKSGLPLRETHCDPAFADVDTPADYWRWLGGYGPATELMAAS